jgi:hypothetical protein
MLGLTGAVAFGIFHAALSPLLGLAAPSVAWCMAAWLYLVLAWRLMRRATDFRLGRRNALVLALAAPVFAALSRLSGWGLPAWAAGAALVALWLAIAIRPGDIEAPLVAI